MLVVMRSHASEEEVRAVCQRIESLGLKAHPIPGTIRTAIGITGNKGAVDLGVLESLPGVVECIPVSKPYKLVSRDAGGAVRGGKRRAGICDCRARGEKRSAAVSRRGVQTADFAVQFSGIGRAGAEDVGKGAE